MARALVPLRKTQLPAEPLRVYPTPTDPNIDIDYEPPADQGIGLGTVLGYVLGALIAVQLLPAITATKHTISSVVTQTIPTNSPQSQ